MNPKKHPEARRRRPQTRTLAQRLRDAGLSYMRGTAWKYVSRSKYKPHQSLAERARRIRQAHPCMPYEEAERIAMKGMS